MKIDAIHIKCADNDDDMDGKMPARLLNDGSHENSAGDDDSIGADIDMYTSNLVLNSLSDEMVDKIKVGSKGPRGCTYPSTYDLTRSDAAWLTPEKVIRMMDRAMMVNHNLNHGGGAPNPINPNQRYAVTIDPVSELVVGVSLVSVYNYLGIMSVYVAALTRFDYSANIDERLRYNTQRGFYYMYEKKHVNDPGRYFSQTESDVHIKLAANLLCIPRIAMGFTADIDGYMMGPEDVSIIREEEEVGSVYHKWDLWKKNSERGARYPVSEEWQKEYHGIIPLREIEGIEKVKCMVFVENERK